MEVAKTQDNLLDPVRCSTRIGNKTRKKCSDDEIRTIEHEPNILTQEINRGGREVN